MHHRTWNRLALTAALCTGLAALSLVAITGCRRSHPGPAPSSQVPGQPAQDQRLFASDEEAVKTLLEAVNARDTDQIRNIFGPAPPPELLCGDPAEDRRGFDNFARHAAEQLRLEKLTDRKSVVHVGQKDWPFPFPIVQTSDGKWFFDTLAGKDEILARRIGHNELQTIKVCRAFVQAQREYAAQDRDGTGVLKYARHFRSTPGTRDGLYWDAAPGEEQSPAGPLIADAALKAYSPSETTSVEPRPYQGYFFHILTRQGPAAPGGRYDYVINGNMIAGFSLVASPAKYGSSGIMTFIISHNGKLYQKDLGPHTHELVLKMTEYNPDGTWRLVSD